MDMNENEFWIGAITILLVLAYMASRGIKDLYDYWNEGWGDL